MGGDTGPNQGIHSYIPRYPVHARAGAPRIPPYAPPQKGGIKGGYRLSSGPQGPGPRDTPYPLDGSDAGRGRYSLPLSHPPIHTYSRVPPTLCDGCGGARSSSETRENSRHFVAGELRIDIPISSMIGIVIAGVRAPTPLLPRSCLVERRAHPHMDEIVDDSLSEQASRVAAVVAEARARKAEQAVAQKAQKAAVGTNTADSAAYNNPVYDIEAVDVDMCLSFNEADTSFVEAEADGVFDAIDQDRDGEITKEELQRHLAGNDMLKPDAVERIFALVDVAPTDGSISRSELRKAFSRHECITLRLALGLASGMRRPRGADSTPAPSSARVMLADEVFDIIDTNQDGQISKGELRAHLVNRGVSVSETTADALFTAMDIDHDGSISRSELRDAFGRYEYPAVRLALGFPRRAVV